MPLQANLTPPRYDYHNHVWKVAELILGETPDKDEIVYHRFEKRAEADAYYESAETA